MIAEKVLAMQLLPGVTPSSRSSLSGSRKTKIESKKLECISVNIPSSIKVPNYQGMDQITQGSSSFTSIRMRCGTALTPHATITPSKVSMKRSRA